MSQDFEPGELYLRSMSGNLDDLLKYLENNSSSKPCDSTSPTTDPPASSDPSEISMSSLTLREGESSTSGASNITRDVSALVNATDDSGDTALVCAAAAVHDVSVRTLIRAGADVNKADASDTTPLMLVVGADSTDIVGDRQINSVKLLLQAGANLNAKDKNGCTALMEAARAKSVNSVQLLLKAGADVEMVNNKGQTALMIASANGSCYCVEFLVKEPNCQKDAMCDRGKTALIYAVAGFRERCIKGYRPPGDCCLDYPERYCECVKLLVEAGVDVNIRDEDGNTALMYASSNDAMVDLLRPMLQADGVDVNLQDYEGMTAVVHAVSSGSPQSLQCLVNSGASVNTVGGYQNKTPLHYLMFKHTDSVCAEQCLKILLDRGANVNAADVGGVTPLMHVTQKNMTPYALSLLVDNGANVNLVDKEGRSALMYLMEPNNSFPGFENVKYLLQNGADPNVKSLRGHSALACALHTKHLALLKLLVEHGVEMKVEWDEFQELLNSTGYTREILQLLITNGMMPTTQVSSTGEHCTSFIRSALQKWSHIDITRYFIANSYLHIDDFKFIFYHPSAIFAPRPVGYSTVQLLLPELISQPIPLVKLCFVTVSTLLGASPGRHERIKKSQLPNRIQDMLMFKDSKSRLCHYNWDRIRLTFRYEEYERLPSPRPLLYNWPVGQRLVTCKCGKCDGTMYKYEGDHH